MPVYTISDECGAYGHTDDGSGRTCADCGIDFTIHH